MPAPAQEFSELNDPAPSAYDPSEYPSEAAASEPGEPLAFPGSWSTDDSYEETPNYERPLPNGLVEVEREGLHFSTKRVGAVGVARQRDDFMSLRQQAAGDVFARITKCSGHCNFHFASLKRDVFVGFDQGIALQKSLFHR